MPGKHLASLLLCVLTLVVYGQVVVFDFVDWDDPKYVTENDHVRAGLTIEGLYWAVKSDHISTWQPMTWLSFMLDSQIYGLNPAGFHLTNLLLHLANTLLLYGLLQRMTRATWRSAMVAALFSVHPLHVESVAWVTERKDVLSTMFGMLSIWAYVTYARGGGLGRYLLTAALLALSLMAKPMLMTLPVVLLLLDYWPLERIRSVGTHQPTALAGKQFTLIYLMIEKIPLLGLSVVSGIISSIVQRSGDALASTDAVPMFMRMVNALCAYAWYLVKMVWPSDLSILYLHPSAPGGTAWTRSQVIGAAFLLLAISALVIRARHLRYAVVGWCWYLITLLPVIGLVQFGSHAMADRFTYVPLIGIFVIISWASWDLVARWQLGPRLRGVNTALVAAGVLVGLMACSWCQARFWRNSETLYRHALEITPHNPTIHLNLGNVLASRDNLDEAVKHYRHALEVDGTLAKAQYGWGNALLRQNNHEAAIRHYRQALQIDSGFKDVHSNLGSALAMSGQISAALQNFHEAVRLNPDDAEANFNLGQCLQITGQFDSALEYYRSSAALDGDDFEVRRRIAWILSTNPTATTPQAMEAIRYAERAAQLSEYRDAIVLDTLAVAYAASGDFNKAVATAKEAIEFARAAQMVEMMDPIRMRIGLYTRRQPYRLPLRPARDGGAEPTSGNN